MSQNCAARLRGREAGGVPTPSDLYCPCSARRGTCRTRLPMYEVYEYGCVRAHPSMQSEYICSHMEEPQCTVGSCRVSAQRSKGFDLTSSEGLPDGLGVCCVAADTTRAANHVKRVQGQNVSWKVDERSNRHRIRNNLSRGHSWQRW